MGVPMATDIAFALGVVILLGKRVPAALKIFLVALAIVDDLGAVLVIAFFYTSNLSWVALGVAGGFLASLIAVNRMGIRRPAVLCCAGHRPLGGFPAKRYPCNAGRCFTRTDHSIG